jgi:hypothetical protein
LVANFHRGEKAIHVNVQDFSNPHREKHLIIRKTKVEFKAARRTQSPQRGNFGVGLEMTLIFF